MYDGGKKSCYYVCIVTSLFLTCSYSLPIPKSSSVQSNISSQQRKFEALRKMIRDEFSVSTENHTTTPPSTSISYTNFSSKYKKLSQLLESNIILSDSIANRNGTTTSNNSSASTTYSSEESTDTSMRMLFQSINRAFVKLYSDADGMMMPNTTNISNSTTHLNITMAMNNENENNKDNKDKDDISVETTADWIQKISGKVFKFVDTTRHWILKTAMPKWIEYNDENQKLKNSMKVHVIVHNESMIIGRVDNDDINVHFNKNMNTTTGLSNKEFGKVWKVGNRNSSSNDNSKNMGMKQIKLISVDYKKKKGRVFLKVDIGNGTILRNYMETNGMYTTTQDYMSKNESIIASGNTEKGNMTQVNMIDIKHIRIQGDENGYSIIVPRKKLSIRRTFMDEHNNEYNHKEEDEVEFLKTQLICQKKYWQSGIQRMLCTCDLIHTSKKSNMKNKLMCKARIADRIIRTAGRIGAPHIAEEIHKQALICKGITDKMKTEKCLSEKLKDIAGENSMFHQMHGRMILSNEGKQENEKVAEYRQARQVEDTILAQDMSWDEVVGDGDDDDDDDGSDNSEVDGMFYELNKESVTDDDDEGMGGAEERRKKKGGSALIMIIEMIMLGGYLTGIVILVICLLDVTWRMRVRYSQVGACNNNSDGSSEAMQVERDASLWMRRLKRSLTNIGGNTRVV